MAPARPESSVRNRSVVLRDPVNPWAGPGIEQRRIRPNALVLRRFATRDVLWKRGPLFFEEVVMSHRKVVCWTWAVFCMAMGLAMVIAAQGSANGVVPLTGEEAASLAGGGCDTAFSAEQNPTGCAQNPCTLLANVVPAGAGSLYQINTQCFTVGPDGGIIYCGAVSLAGGCSPTPGKKAGA